MSSSLFPWRLMMTFFKHPQSGRHGRKRRCSSHHIFSERHVNVRNGKEDKHIHTGVVDRSDSLSVARKTKDPTEPAHPTRIPPPGLGIKRKAGNDHDETAQNKEQGCADADRRARIDRAINDNEVCDVNPFGVIATQAAYNEGEAWLNQLVEYLHANYLYMRDFCRKHLPEFPVTVLEGTYLVWMDCRKLGISSEELERRLVSEARLWLNAGTMYGAEGEGFMRWNIACPRNTLTEGLKRFSGFAGTIAETKTGNLR